MQSAAVKKALGRLKLGAAEPKWVPTVCYLHPPLNYANPLSTPRHQKSWMPWQGQRRTLRMPHPPKTVSRPPKLVFSEDETRRLWFKRHPTEAWRPVTLAEGAGLRCTDGTLSPDW